MQENFIKELEEQGKTNIAENSKKRDKLGNEICVLTTQNEELDLEVTGLLEDQEKLAGAGEKLLKLNTFKGKLQVIYSDCYIGK